MSADLQASDVTIVFFPVVSIFYKKFDFSSISSPQYLELKTNCSALSVIGFAEIGLAEV